MEVVACTHQACKSNCNEYGIFFVPSVCRRYCGQNGRSLLYQDQGFARRCLFRWYSTNHPTYIIQGMKRCARILRWIRRSVEQAKLVLSNVTIISRESPICNTLMKKNHKEQKRQGYALEIWCYWSNIWIAWRGCIWQLVKCVAKNIHGVSDMQEACMFQEWKEHD